MEGAKQDKNISVNHRFADVLCCIVDHLNHRVVALYSDGILFIWNVKQLERISVFRSFISHKAPIHDIQYISNSLPIGHTNFGDFDVN